MKLISKEVKKGTGTILYPDNRNIWFSWKIKFVAVILKLAVKKHPQGLEIYVCPYIIIPSKHETLAHRLVTFGPTS